MNEDDRYRTILGNLGPWLISDRPKGSDFESFPRRAQCPRYRQRALVPWQPKRKRRRWKDR